MDHTDRQPESEARRLEEVVRLAEQAQGSLLDSEIAALKRRIDEIRGFAR